MIEEGREERVRNYSSVCVDASLVVRLHDSSKLEHAKAVELWEEWSVRTSSDRCPVALAIRSHECGISLGAVGGHLVERAGRLAVGRARASADSLCRLPLRCTVEAFEFARRFDAKTHTTATIWRSRRREGVPLITADKKLVNAAQFHILFVRYRHGRMNAGPSWAGVLSCDEKFAVSRSA